ncbi:MAG: DUF1207 domain-containing protein [Candidatus Paracaedibacteraceae bacterium]|nr:DUF1207 domain-containing protein [Candidatus Paracaedibacteraceae bacterium]
MPYCSIVQPMKLCIGTLCLILHLISPTWAQSEDYLTGYVAAVINEALPEDKLKYFIEGDQLTIIVIGTPLDHQVQDKLISRLKASTYFARINISSLEDDDIKKKAPNTYESATIKTSPASSKLKIIPNGVIYEAPIADPKWPKFSVGYQHHFNSVYGKNIFDLAFGENLALLRYHTPKLVYEIGIQAGLTGLMDFSQSPSRLINSDYFVGIGLSVVYDKKWQNLIQFSHISSHIGDEFIISRPRYLDKRINLSYEALKWYTAYKLDSFRPYIGFGYLMDRDPSYLKPFTIETGVDYISKTRILWDKARFVFGMNTFFWNETRYSPRLNVSTDVQIDNSVWSGRTLKFLINYTNGNSRHGQFYKKREKYFGVSINICS